MSLSPLMRFLRGPVFAGLLLFSAGALGMLSNNSALSPLYEALLNTPMEIRVGTWQLGKPLLQWINDGLMTLFFLFVGLQLKQELLEGQLSTLRRALLPGIAAMGGMLLPALIYLLVNHGDPVARHGWAIPAATDIAFTLAVLSLLGKRVPRGLLVFVMSLAVIDDLGAIVIIALAYTHQLSLLSLGLAGGAGLLLLLLNRLDVTRIELYILAGILLWLFVLKSGVHATMAGVVVAFAIPLHCHKERRSPLRNLEWDLHPWVTFAILPLFAFANSGLPLAHLEWASLLHPVPLGIAAGLFLGKQVGVFSFCWLSIRLGLTRLPPGVRWRQIYGAAILCGIGYTMSLFIGSLAFEMGGPDFVLGDRLGILMGSILSGVVGWLVLRLVSPPLPVGEESPRELADLAPDAISDPPSANAKSYVIPIPHQTGTGRGEAGERPAATAWSRRRRQRSDAFVRGLA